MGYRNITVDDRNYKYVVGTTHVKIKGVGVWSKEDIGELEETRCECCGETLNSIRGSDDYYSLRVKPSNIAHKIMEMNKK